jgi:hypothetical protein
MSDVEVVEAELTKKKTSPGAVEGVPKGLFTNDGSSAALPLTQKKK